VVGLYLLFVVFRLFLLVRAGVRTARIRAAAGPVSGLLVERVWARCAAAFGIRAELRSSRSLAGPVTAGRTVILPAGLVAESSNDLLTTAIAHEMAHVARWILR
jgi:Zn-dependent protease with chaperone function